MAFIEKNLRLFRRTESRMPNFYVKIRIRYLLAEYRNGTDDKQTNDI